MLLFLSYKVKLLAKLLTPPFRTGQIRITTAIEKIVTKSGVKKEIVKCWYKRKRVYLKLAEVGGLGSLL